MKTLLIDDHPLILAALQAVIQGLDSEASVVSVGSAQAAREALADDSEFDLVLLDLHLGDADGFELLVELRAAHPSLPVVVVSASDSNAQITRAIYLGAMGFVPKRASNELLLEALHRVMAGGIYVPPMVLRSHSAALQPSAKSDRDGWGLRLDDGPPGIADPNGRAPLASLGLTVRQTDVLALLLQGQSNKLIARALHLSVETIKDHVAAIFRALNVNSRTQAVLAANQQMRTGAASGWRDAPHIEARHS